jgi:hypothetical protein
MDDWTDRLVGARMALDQEFEEQVRGSRFSRQEWGLVMTAVEFRIEDAGDPDRARLVGDTSNLEAIIPEMERVAQQQSNMHGAGGDDDSGGIIDNVLGALGLGGSEDTGVDEEKVAAAESLVADYTDELQVKLEEQGRWDEIREAAAAQAN